MYKCDVFIEFVDDYGRKRRFYYFNVPVRYIEGESVKIKDFDCNFYVSYERIILLVINGITYVNKRKEKR